MSYIPRFAEAAVPRYTSYPTANQFTEIDSTIAVSWLAASSAAQPVSLYVHIPYCRSLCWYCGCHTHITNKRAPIRSYVDALIREIGIVASHLPARMLVSHLHFGGGTHNILEPSDLDRIMEELRKRFSFQDDAEIAVEIDPRVLTEAFAKSLGQHGFNRASLGIQDVSLDVQRKINRVQTQEQVETALENLHRYSINKINMDLLYGLPGQTVDHVIKSAEMIRLWGADRVAVFGYAHVPWFKKNQQIIEINSLSCCMGRFQQARAIEKHLIGSGMVAIGLDHFAKTDDPLTIAKANGTLRRNFQGYTTDTAQTMIGFGPSSISQFAQGFVQNDPHVGRYRDAIQRETLPVARGLPITTDDRFRAELIEKLMCHGTLDIAAICKEHGREPDELGREYQALMPLIDHGIATLSGHQLSATERGRAYIRCIAACFDDHLKSAAAKHSSAV